MNGQGISSVTEPEILYEDECIVVAVKPYGMLSESHDSLPSMPAALSELMSSRIYTVHRLDRTTVGLTVYAKTSAAAASLSAQIQDGRFKKTYLAVVEGTPDDSGEMVDLLYYDRARSKSYVVKRMRRGVREACLSYERLGGSTMGATPVSLVKIRLTTGRTHQIRVQFASRKTPLVGDRRYGSALNADNIALCSHELSFNHPQSGEEMNFSYAPHGEAFDLFG